MDITATYYFNLSLDKEQAPKTRILLFIGCLGSGGKERRLVELLTCLVKENKYEFLVAMTRDEIVYTHFFTLNVPYMVLEKKWKKYDPRTFWQFYRLCRQFRPDIIHTWGRMQTMYSLPASRALNIPLVNSQITGAPTKNRKWSLNALIDRINFFYSDSILSNSYAGMDVYLPPAGKSRVIHNGINLQRFEHLQTVGDVRRKYNIATPHMVIMAATISEYKDYRLFYKVAEQVTRWRRDITFIGAGGYVGDDTEYRNLLAWSAGNTNIRFTGRVNEVESLINASTLGVLFSRNGEGISNSIMEYMSLSKPVIANNTGGNKELVFPGVNGYLINHDNVHEIADLVTTLVDNPALCAAFGKKGREIIESKFSLQSMGRGFQEVYSQVLENQLASI